ncbi:SpoIIE family protein phosphatase [Mobilitalea sibirica]|uniref:SpoIIE family protein phosphatase n=1 Tax=Mobilitalea sibirica TaxID=1462919 RepID=A0A8J7H243_9FIRM|nr:SpoIIE family protein phosphatase [Mobilitalea sibirica]MBH1940739.1 SpoIIE family protein phosphatase [Mobilitalea sibirica]
MRDNRKRSILVHGIGLFVARAVFFSINPLAIGYFTAAYLERAGGGLIFIAVFIGIATVMTPTIVLKYLLTMIITVVIIEAPYIKKKNIPKQVLYILPAIFLGLLSLMDVAIGGWQLSETLIAILESALAFISGMVFRSGIDFLYHGKRGNRLTNEQSVSLALMVAVVIFTIPDYNNAYIAPVETVVYFVVLFFTYKYGIGQGAVAGAVSGFALSLRGASFTDIGILSLMGIVPSIFRELGRIPTATVFTVTAAITGLMFEEMALAPRDIGALASAVIIFLLLPRSLIYRIDFNESYGGWDYLASVNLKKVANTRMKIFSDSFLKLSKTLNTISERQTNIKQQDINYIFEDISDKLCKNCRNCSICWEQNFQETYQAACKMFDIAEKNGFIKKEEIPESFLDICICTDQFVTETNRGFEIAKLNYIWNSRLAESREVIAEQLKEVSGVIQNITGDIYGAAQTLRMEEDLVVRKLRSAYIHAKNVTIIERKDKRKEVYLSAAVGKDRCVTAKEAAVLVGEALGVKMRLSDASKTVITREIENFIFVEDTKFKVLTGVARAMKDNVSGDNFSILKLETGEIMVALADGMGTGKEAGDESETVMGLLEQLIEAGFKTETAIKLINSSLVLKADKQIFTTIDMSIINLFTGMCEFIKIGAASAFIKRDNWVETISSTTLPIGMFGNVDYDAVTKKLYEGDIVIMVTDGVLDSIKGDHKEEFIEKLIMEIKSNNPQEIANRILDHTLAQSNYTPMDDMTVITAGIWLK